MKHHAWKLILFTGIVFFLLWIDVLLGHFGENLHHKWMWLPLVFLPFATFFSCITAFRTTKTFQTLFFLISLLAILLGLLGFFFHLLTFLNSVKGEMSFEVLIHKMRYPPLIAPLAITGLGVLGVLVQPFEYKKK